MLKAYLISVVILAALTFWQEYQNMGAMLFNDGIVFLTAIYLLISAIFMAIIFGFFIGIRWTVRSIKRG